MFVLGNSSGLFNTNRVAQAALVLWVMDVETGYPTHLFPVEPMTLFPNHLHDGGFVLIGPHDSADADLAHGFCH